MLWRPLQHSQLVECLNLVPDQTGEDVIGRERALAAWHALLDSSSFQGIVVSETASPESPVLGFGASVFVESRFADAQLANPTPGLNSRIMESIHRDASVVLDRRSLAIANAARNLRLVVLCGTWNRLLTDPAKIAEVQLQLAMSFLEVHSGYHLTHFLSELTNPIDLEYAKSLRVWRMVAHFSDPSNPDTIQRTLAVVDRESALLVPGSVATAMFQSPDPVLALRPSEQDLLTQALGGFTDEELARQLDITVVAVKRRWASVIDRTRSSLPDLLPAETEGSRRGKQKRHHLLAYLRAHPEELRPWTKSPGATITAPP